jgi:hypothetical protein
MKNRRIPADPTCKTDPQYDFPELSLATNRVFFYLFSHSFPTPIRLSHFSGKTGGKIMASLKWIIMVACLFMAAGCDETSETPEGALADYSSCKNFLDETDTQAFAFEDGQECVEYDFSDDGILYLKHINADFNCCPDSLDGVVSVEENIITIEEQAVVTSPCDCECLYDLNYEIFNLEPGVYTLALDQIEDLRIDLDLVSEPSGTFCVPRETYPWS